MSWERSRRISPGLIEAASTGSTNADLAAAVRAGDETRHLAVLLTRDQRSGRGRLGRVWTAPAGAALAVSVLVRVGALPGASRGWLPLLAGVAMREAVAEQLPGRPVGVKWPNDILVSGDGGGKLVGVLAEVAAADAVVIGTGVNTNLPAADLPVPTATSFAALGSVCDEDLLVASYLGGLERRLSALVAAGGDAAASGALAETTRVCVTIGRDVRVELPGGGDLCGAAVRLDPDGRLVVAAAGGETAVSAGDVVHVR